MEIIGKIIEALPVQEGVAKSTGKPWKKRLYILETQETYPRKVAVTVFGVDRVNQYESMLTPGVNVTASVDVESREFNGRWYTDVSAWKFEIQGQTTPGGGYSAPDAAAYGAPAVTPPPAIMPSEPSDDLPF